MVDGVAASDGSAPAPATGSARSAAASITKATTVGSTSYVTAVAPRHSLFSRILDDLNPLQYIPVVGDLYREMTGDEGNSDLRFAASLGTSFALGGPIGVAITVGEKLTGIDPERAVLHAARQLLHLGEAPHQSRSGAAASASAPAASAPAGSATRAGPSLAFSVDSHAMTADDLNALELRRLAHEDTAVAQADPPASRPTSPTTGPSNAAPPPRG